MEAKRAMKNRLLSLILAIVTVMSTVPMTGITSSAVSSDVIAWNDTDNDGVIDGNEKTYTDLNVALRAGGTVKLTGDDALYTKNILI